MTLFCLIVLKPLCAECHVIMDQSSEILLDVPKVTKDKVECNIELKYFCLI